MKTTIFSLVLVLASTLIATGQYAPPTRQSQKTQMQKRNVHNTSALSNPTATQRINEPDLSQTMFTRDIHEQSGSIQQNQYDNSSNEFITSPVAVPRDLLDLTGLWKNDKIEVIAAIMWNGAQWVGVVQDRVTNRYLKKGEIILELTPINPEEVMGRIKVTKKRGKFEWKEVKYDISFTKLRGKYEWKFFGK